MECTGRELVFLYRVTRCDHVIRDRRKARVLVKPVRVARCSRAVQKKSEQDDKSVPRRCRRRPRAAFKTLSAPVF